MSAFNSHIRQNACYRNLKRTFEDFCRVLLRNKTNSRTIRSQVSQPASAGKGADMSELQDYHSLTPEQ